MLWLGCLHLGYYIGTAAKHFGRLRACSSVTVAPGEISESGCELSRLLHACFMVVAALHSVLG